jgi:cyclohexyl-isocyanide hydratase
MSQSKPPAAGREARLKDALRANLRRRKAAAAGPAVSPSPALLNPQTPVFHVGFVLFPNLTQLDFTGPLQILHRMPGAQTHILSATMDPVATDCGLSLVPTGTFDTAPQLDLICVPGGFGVNEAMLDPVLLDFVRRQAAGARFVTSVCTGALILGAAGLLQGRRATVHWAYRDFLPRFGAIDTPGRVVRDGNLFTGGGVTAGIDFALTVLAEISGPEVAQAVQLSVEYDPAPPFDAGSPERAPAPVLGRIQGLYDRRRGEVEAAVAKAAAALDQAPV